jgi:uncharacterized protein YcbK (DUF882 family)
MPYICQAMIDLKHFLLSEFDSPDALGSGSKMQSEFLKKLDNARGISGLPFKINSGYRTIAYNTKIKGAANSAHTKGWAADIAYTTGAEGYKILRSLQEVGFNRIGIYKTWIHVDCDPSLPPNVIWSK